MLSIKKKAFILGLLLIQTLSVDISAQNAICVDNSQVSYSIKNYQGAQGLPQNTVKDMARDPAGFLWITTEKGLSRFDGTYFRNYTGLPYNSRNNRIGPIHRIGDTLVFPDRPNLALTESTIIHDEKTDFLENYYTACSGQTFLKDKYPLLSHVNVDLVFFRDDFFGSGDSTFYYRAVQLSDPKKLRRDDQLHFYKNGVDQGAVPHTQLPNLWNKKIFFFEGRLCVIDTNSILRIYKGVELVDSLNVDFLGKDVEVTWSAIRGSVYVHSRLNSMLYQVVLNNNEFCLKLLVSDFEVQRINCVLQMNAGNDLWVGSSTRGLYHFKRHRLTALYSVENGPYNNMRSVYEIGKDSLVSEGGLILSAKGAHLLPKDSTVVNPVLVKAQKFADKHKRIGFNVIRGFYTASILGMAGPEVVMDKSNRLWRVVDSTLCYHNNQRNWEKPETLEAVKQNFHYDLFYNPYRDEIWIFSNEEKKNTFIYSPADDRLRKLEGVGFKGEVQEILFSEDGIAWICVFGDGFYMYRDGRLVQMPMDPLNYLINVHCILEDSRGFFWITSDFGLFKVLKQDLLDRFDDPEKQVYYAYYDKSWGLRNNEFNGSGYPCGTIMSDGKFAFPGLEGAVLFDPHNMDEEEYGQKIVVDEVKLDGKDTLFDQEWVLNDRYDEIELKVAFAFYSHPNNLYIQYKLEGHHQNWQDVPPDRKIRIKRLKYGNYTLRVRKLAGHGGKNFISLSIPIVINTWVYQTWWFRTLAVFAILMLIGGILYLIIKRYRAKQSELERVIVEETEGYRSINHELKCSLLRLKDSQQELHEFMRFKNRMMAIYAHDTGLPLRFVANLARNTVQAIDKLKKKDLIRYFNLIEDSTQKVFQQTEQMFRISNMDSDDTLLKTEQLDFSLVAERCLKNFEAQATEKNTALVSMVEPGFLLMADVNILDVILNNLLQNAVKYTQDGVITIDAFQLKHYSKVTISDTGLGMSAERLQILNKGQYRSMKGTNNEEGKGFGLKVVRDFLAKMNGHLTMDSKLRKGTTVNLFFKNKGSIEDTE